MNLLECKQVRTRLPTDRRLLDACRSGESWAWESLVDKYERLVFSIALNHGLSTDDADDITQLTFTYLIESLDSLREDSNLGAWLGTVARRHTWRFLDRNRRLEKYQVDPYVLQTLLPSKAAAMDIQQWEVLEWLHSGLAALGARCEQLLIALYFDPQEPSYADIAKKLKLAEGSIGPTRARCLQQLKKFLEEA